ncbi:Nucleic-acid-binding protein from transposon X-element [Araneus ventricosus]|uniref:Nucleic-acid-binding protein from transposon X-element n=1 Tax=Araneus ventricosus TaxID=182803 RepID=A0A4Y2PUI2_ARAVE|nr:Nucleic-acid-binding protein from transposon X-element [Araneus ventricosus]
MGEELQPSKRICAEMEAMQTEISPDTTLQDLHQSCLKKRRIESELRLQQKFHEGYMNVAKALTRDQYCPGTQDQRYGAIITSIQDTERIILKLQDELDSFPPCMAIDTCMFVIDGGARNTQSEFKSPNRKVTSKKVQPIKAANSIKLTNKFEGLEEINDSPESSSDTNEQNKDSPKHRIPPIMLKHHENYATMLDAIYEKFNLEDNIFGNGFIKVYPKTAEMHKELQEFCKLNNYEFYIIKPKEQRPFRVVIKGLPEEHNTDRIINYINEIGFNATKVVRLTQQRTRKPLPMFLVELEKTPDVTNIFKIERINRIKVNIVDFIPRQQIQQCFACNRFGHSASGCGFRPRCLKCGQSHTTKQCSITERVEKPVCINCGKEGHVAAYRGCEAFPKISKKQTNNSPRTFNANQALVNNNKSYAQATSPPAQQMDTPKIITQAETTTQPETINFSAIKTEIAELILAVRELRSIFSEVPALLTAAKEMQKKDSKEDKLSILINTLAATANPIQL